MEDARTAGTVDATAGVPPVLGHVRQRIVAAAGLPLDERPAAFDEVHRLLAEALSGVERPGEGDGSRPAAPG